MSSINKKSSKSSSSSRSGTGSSSKSSSKSGSKTGSKSKSSPKGDSTDDWSDWEWDSAWQREWRSRLGADGKTWEYEYRYGESTPRSLATGGPTGGGDGLGSLNEGLEGEDLPSPIPILARPSTSPSEAGVNYTTASTAAGYETNLAISHLSRNLGQIRVDSSLSQDDSSGYGAQQRSMVDDSGIPIPRAQQNPQGYAYSKSPPNAQSSFPSSLPRTGPSNTTFPPYGTQNSAGQWSTSFQSPLERVQSGSVESDLYISGSAQQESGMPKKSELHRDFKVHPAKDFKFGFIFKILWTEPRGQGMPANHKGTEVAEVYQTKFGEEYYASIRRFVIVTADHGHCLCLPILTYKKQATIKKGVKPQDHAIIYTEDKNRKGEKPTEAPGEEKLQNKPIRMDSKTARDQLDPLSRLNYAKIYTVEYNVKVCFIGSIHGKSVDNFCKAYNLKHQPLPVGDSVEFEDDNGDQ